MSEIVYIPFQGDNLPAVAGEDGKPLVGLRAAVEALEMNYSNVVRKLKTRSWACLVQVTMQVGGQSRQVTVVPVRTLTMWLAGVNEHEVREDRREKLITYQAEVADAIEAYWLDGVSVNPRLSEDEAKAAFDKAVKGHTHAARMREAKERKKALAEERRANRNEIDRLKAQVEARDARGDTRVSEALREVEAKRADELAEINSWLRNQLETKPSTVPPLSPPEEIKSWGLISVRGYLGQRGLLDVCDFRVIDQHIQAVYKIDSIHTYCPFTEQQAAHYTWDVLDSAVKDKYPALRSRA